MLSHCAPGYEKKGQTHSWCVMYNGITFPTLPLGKHGRRENPEIEIFHVKKMIRDLEIMSCAGMFNPVLR